MGKYNYVQFCENYLISKFLFKTTIIKYEDIEKIYYYKWNFKRFILSRYSQISYPGRLNIVLKNKNPINIHVERIYPIFYKYKNLNKLPEIIKKKLIITP